MMATMLVETWSWRVSILQSYMNSFPASQKACRFNFEVCLAKSLVFCVRGLHETLPSQIVEFLNVTEDGIHNYQWYVKGYVFNHFI